MSEIKSRREVESLLVVLQFTVKILFPRHHHVLFPLFSSLFIAYKNQKKREVHVKLQPLPDELLFKLNSQSHFQSDIHNCAFVNDKILNILNVRTGYWVKVTGYNSGKEFTERNYDCIDTIDSDQGFQYCLLRVIGMSCIESSTAHVSYVTFHNLDRTVHIRDLIFLTSFENFTKHNITKFNPHFASRAVISLVKTTIEIEETFLDKSLSRFFENAKYLCKGDSFTIDAVHFVPEIVYNSECYNCNKLHFVVCEIEGPDYELNKDINCGYYVLKGETTLIQSKNCQTYLPPKHQTINCNLNSFAENQYLSYLISVSPSGLCKYSDELRQCIKPFVQTSSQLRNSNIKPLFLIYGPRGSGKKLIVTSVAKQLGLNIWIVDCCDIQSNTAASTEGKLKSVFNKVKEFVPCIVLLKNIETLCVNKHEMEDIRTINAFNEEVRNINQNHGEFPVIVIATCNSKNEQLSNLSAALARAFLSTIWITFPDEVDRLSMLEWMTKFYDMKVHSEVSLKTYAAQTSGFHFGDLSAFLSHAARNLYKDFTENIKIKSTNSIDTSLRKKDFDKALGLMQNIFSDAIGAPKIPAVSWEDVGGLSDLKEEIIRTIMLPIKHPELVSTGLRSGLLLFGPPGTGKTLLAKAVATECSLNFLSVKGPELLNMYVGQSEENVRDGEEKTSHAEFITWFVQHIILTDLMIFLHRMKAENVAETLCVFARARSASPCIIFFDELDSLAPNRGKSGDSGGVMDRVVSQLLSEMDGIQKSTKIFVIGATNRPDLIDPALLRPGRFDKLLYVGMCSDTASKLSVLKSLTRKFKLKPEVNLNEIVASLPADVTGADIYSVCSTAWLNAVRTIIHGQKLDNKSNEANSQFSLVVEVGVEDFAAGTQALIPSVSVDDMNYYKKIRYQMSS